MLIKMVKLLLLLYPSLVSANEVCNILNKDYNFSYTMKNDTIIYEIEKKDKSLFNYYEPFIHNDNNYPTEFGIFFENKQNNLKKFQENKLIKDKYEKFYVDNGQYYSPNYLISLRKRNTLSANNFKEVISIKGNINLDKFIFDNENLFPNIYLTKNQVIYIKLKIILDPNLNNCLVFSSEPIKYNFTDLSFYWKKIQYYIKDVNDFFKLY